ncbi:MAG: TAT-variant-translocated molybdopterin oxidoreductase [Bacteroidota bacterium]
MSRPKYWRGIEELEQSPEFIAQRDKEFSTDIPMEDALSNASEESLGFNANRRDFLKVMGFGMTAATLSACFEAPTKKAIPYVQKPDDQIPGVANFYASTTPEGNPVLVKTRVGRPIKLEGNPDSYISHGGLDTIGQASILGLYDEDRLRAPYKGGNPSEWDVIDNEIAAKIEELKQSGQKVRVLSSTVLSPSTQAVIDEFLAQFPEGQASHVTYDPVSVSSILDAHEASFGTRTLPSYNLQDAEVIASFACDFLGTWICPSEFTWKYVANRDPKAGKMSRHFQVESLMSLTGANADMRFPVQPSQVGLSLLNLHNKVAKLVGKPTLPGVEAFNVAANGLDKIANELVEARGKSLVLCGVNDSSIQQVVNAINFMLDNYGSTLDLDNPSHMRKGDDGAVATLADELAKGEVGGLFLYEANPAYNSVFAEAFKKAVPELALSVSFSQKLDETAELCEYVCPDSHYLESWGDKQQAANLYSVVQPAINPIFNTRQVEDSFLTWTGNTTDFHDYLKARWATVYAAQESDNFVDAQAFWDDTLRKGVYETAKSSGGNSSMDDAATLAAARNIDAGSGDSLEMVMYEKVAIRNGKYANNPWLQELPDPVTRVAWDNYLVVSNAYAKENGLKNEDVVSVSIDGLSEAVELPVYVQPGLAKNTVGVAVGYGRSKNVGKVAATTGGYNAYQLLSENNGNVSFQRGGISITKTAKTYPMALTQTFDTLYDPEKVSSFGDSYDRTDHIIRETALPFFNGEGGDDNPYRENVEKWDEKRKHLVTLWESHFKDPETNRVIRWAMAIDLNKCTGCGACIISCHAENNVPVVGKKEVRDRRNMHWLRIDRYYSGDTENPDVVFQPMMCQHCDNAPCETVCPVLATIHSNEGLNQMTYNRCVGTRYCANNCPYKVRRFNWFSYYNDEMFRDVNPSQNELGRLVLNPDVTVRFRGVMEKCSFCVQRLQDAKLKAKIQSNSTFAKPEDSKNLTACQSACGADAIVFGDLNDKNSAVAKLFYDERAYSVIEEVKTLPSVRYMTKVRNRTIEEYKEKQTVKEEEQSFI